jgi:hypothetical protein
MAQGLCVRGDRKVDFLGRKGGWRDDSRGAGSGSRRRVVEAVKSRWTIVIDGRFGTQELVIRSRVMTQVPAVCVGSMEGSLRGTGVRLWASSINRCRQFRISTGRWND